MRKRTDRAKPLKENGKKDSFAVSCTAKDNEQTRMHKNEGG